METIPKFQEGGYVSVDCKLIGNFNNYPTIPHTHIPISKEIANAVERAIKDGKTNIHIGLIR